MKIEWSAENSAGCQVSGQDDTIPCEKIVYVNPQLPNATHSDPVIKSVGH